MHGPAVGLTPLPDTLSSKQKWCWRPNGGGAEPSAPEGAGGTAEGQPEPKEPKGGGGNTNTHSEREGEKGRKAGEMEGDGVRRSWGEQDAPRHCIAAPERGPECLRGAQRSPSSPARTPAAAAPSASSACTGSFAAGGAGGESHPWTPHTPGPGGEWGRVQHSQDPPPHRVAAEPCGDEDLALAHLLVLLPAAPTAERRLDEGGQLCHALLAPLLQVEELQVEKSWEAQRGTGGAQSRTHPMPPPPPQPEPPSPHSQFAVSG